MVTTRSADKRIDPTRGEDLVLRSRTVHSPTLSTPSPSQSRKRSTRERGQLNSPNAKRSRIGLDGADEEDVALGSSDLSRNEPLEVATTLDNTSDVSNSLPEQEVQQGAYLIDRANPTPATKSASQRSAASSATKSDAFTTPATSKHKRYNSEEPDEDTIVVHQSTDSSANNGYQTADEEFEDSDDAPEIASTKISLVAPHQKRIRGSRTKKPAGVSIARHEPADEENLIEPQSVVETADIIAQPSSQVVNLSASKSEVVGLVPDSALDILDRDPDTITVNRDAKTETPSSQVLPLSTEERAADKFDKATDGQPAETSNIIFASLNSHTPPQPQPPAILLSPTIPTQSISLQQQTLSPSSNAAKDLSISKVSKTQLSKNRYPVPPTSRLPDKASKTFESFRRNQLNQRLPVEGNWSKKKSAFALS